MSADTHLEEQKNKMNAAISAGFYLMLSAFFIKMIWSGLQKSWIFH